MRRAFSFIELIIYMGIVSVLMVVMINMFSSTLEVQQKSQTSSSLDLDGQYLLARLNYDVHRAQTISTPASLGQTTSSLTLTISGATYTYSLTNQKMTLTDSLGTEILNSDGVKTSIFSVKRIGDVARTPTVQISLSLESESVSATQAATFRNYLTTITPRLK